MSYFPSALIQWAEHAHSGILPSIQRRLVAAGWHIAAGEMILANLVATVLGAIVAIVGEQWWPSFSFAAAMVILLVISLSPTLILRSVVLYRFVTKKSHNRPEPNDKEQGLRPPASAPN